MPIPFRIHETTGVACCASYDDRGRQAFPENPCEKCIAHFERLVAEHDVRTAEDYAAPDPYKTDVQKLRQRHATPPPASLRPPRDYSPPDPYATDIAALCAAQARTDRGYLPAQRPTEMPLDANGIPDPYFKDLEQLRRANNG